MTTLFLIITVVVSLIAFQNHQLRAKLIFNPYLINSNKEYYRFFTSGFIHADTIHLFVNMFVLYSFGDVVEKYYMFNYGDRGEILFAIMYVSSIMMSLIPTFKSNRFNPGYNGLGASGAVSAVVFAAILFDPIQPLALYGIIRLPGIVFGVLYLFYCYYMGKKGGDNINHSAHMWGAIYGVLFSVVLKPTLLVEFFQKLIYFRNAI